MNPRGGQTRVPEPDPTTTHGTTAPAPSRFVCCAGGRRPGGSCPWLQRAPKEARIGPPLGGSGTRWLARFRPDPRTRGVARAAFRDTAVVSATGHPSRTIGTGSVVLEGTHTPERRNKDGSATRWRDGVSDLSRSRNARSDNRCCSCSERTTGVHPLTFIPLDRPPPSPSVQEFLFGFFFETRAGQKRRPSCLLCCCYCFSWFSWGFRPVFFRPPRKNEEFLSEVRAKRIGGMRVLVLIY
mmetsp:Transcript_24645/g.55047  ORF Transcript_24645/g.55047 Transcript_24645/m.55047 type:complete len:240 (-) Transcript_24645:267-986(-)